MMIRGKIVVCFQMDMLQIFIMTRYMDAMLNVKKKMQADKRGG